MSLVRDAFTVAPAFETAIVVVNGTIGDAPVPCRTSTRQLKFDAYVNETDSLVVEVAKSM